MCAHEPVAAGVREPVARPPAQPHQGYSRKFRSALDSFVRAVADGKSETICSSYMALRSVSGGLPFRQVLAAIDRAIGDNAGNVIVSAFAHRRCFMCGDGTRPCTTCHGGGMVERFRCPNCEGLGVEACPFCLGSGWHAWEDMPEEIRDHARQHRRQRLRKDLDRLAEIPADKATSSARKATTEKRRRWATSLMRLHGKLVVLTRHDSDGEPLTRRCREAIEYIERLLDALRPPNPPVEAGPDPASAD
ncbi:MAG: DnaJ-like cysteine-rich domain-containing protein [Planctomycetota bacterium]|jgi:hypothetical protein